MTVLCPSCGLEPEGVAAGVPCGACGTFLVSVEPKPDPLIGQVVDGRFEVIAKIGAGGMGTVYRAKQRSIGREIALKVLDASVEADAAAIKRFYREAKLASELSHPNTVGVIEFGQHEGRMYLAMELVKGRTLHAVVRADGALPLWRVVRIGVQLCDALEAAHKLSIVHRDLKLENIMLLDESRDLVKILDFGLARSLVDPMSRATMTGVVAGTPRYLPPEVVLHAAEPTPAQDCYALGVIIGELITGRELWRAATLDGLLAMKLNDAPNLTGVQPTLAAVIHGLLAAEPTDRPTAAAVRAELLALKEAPKEPVKVTMPPPLAETLLPPPAEPSQFPVEVVAPPVRAASVGPFRESQLVDLGEVASPRVEETQQQAVPPFSGIPILPEERTEAGKLEVDQEWVAEREAKIVAARTPKVVPKEPFPVVFGVGIAVVVLALAAGAWYLGTHQGSPTDDAKHEGSGSGHGKRAVGPTVKLKILGDAKDVTIAGGKHGAAPMVLEVPRSDQEVMVTGTAKDGRLISRNVTPDHDQVVDLTP